VKARSRPRLTYVVTVPLAARGLLRGQLAHLRDRGFDVDIVSSPGPELDLYAVEEGVPTRGVPMAREIDLPGDLVALGRLFRALRAGRPLVTNVGTPKAGLLGGLASLFARVPVRIYTLRGLRLETTTGLRRLLFTTTERIACLSATHVIAVSPNLRRRALELGLVRPGKIHVVGEGSSNGVVIDRFRASPALLERARVAAAAMGLPPGAPVIGFAGRFTRDKGIVELVAAYLALRRTYPTLRLLLLGRFEDGDPVPEATRRTIEETAGILRPGFVADTAPYYHLMDVLALPTHREGFPNCALEAAAAGKPVVTTDATGAVDAVVHERTGLVVKVGDAEALGAALDKVLASPAFGAALGRAGQERVAESFAATAVWGALERFYRDAIAAAGGRGS
jgi:glycosyltransferase involved in cell wall biosynthesis